MCPPWPPQHVPPWPPQHKPTMGATARATPAPPQAGRHTATAQSGGGAPIVGPLLQQHASALCASGLVGGPAMAATAHHGRHSTPPPWPPGGTPRNGRHSGPPPLACCHGCQPHGALCPAPTWGAQCSGYCSTPPMGSPWPPQHAPTMAATARPLPPWQHMHCMCMAAMGCHMVWAMLPPNALAVVAKACPLCGPSWHRSAWGTNHSISPN